MYISEIIQLTENVHPNLKQLRAARDFILRYVQDFETFSSQQPSGHWIHHKPADDAKERFEYCAKVVCQADGMNLSMIPEPLRSPEICMAAVQSDGKALQLVPVGKRSREICMAAIRTTPSPLDKGVWRFIPQRFRGLAVIHDAFKQGQQENKTKETTGTDPVNPTDVVWFISLPANINVGGRYQYNFISIKVLASSAEQAIDTVNKYKTLVLASLAERRLSNGKRMLPTDVARNVFFKDTYHVKLPDISANEFIKVLTSHGMFINYKVPENYGEIMLNAEQRLDPTKY